jgi:hypothetical protein
VHHKADRNEYLSAYSGTLLILCMKQKFMMNDVLMNDKWIRVYQAKSSSKVSILFPSKYNHEIAYRRSKIHEIMQINLSHGEMFQRIFEGGLPKKTSSLIMLVTRCRSRKEIV